MRAKHVCFIDKGVEQEKLQGNETDSHFRLFLSSEIATSGAPQCENVEGVEIPQ